MIYVDSTPSPGSGDQFSHFQYGVGIMTHFQNRKKERETVIYSTEAWQGGPVGKTAGGLGSILGQGTRSHMLQLKISYATTKTQHNNNNNNNNKTKTNNKIKYSKRKKKKRKRWLSTLVVPQVEMRFLQTECHEEGISLLRQSCQRLI